MWGEEMTDREKFEQEWQKVMGTPASVLERMRVGDKYKHTTHDFLNAAYAIWQAALASQQTADDGWIEWEGGECPVDALVMVEVKLRHLKQSICDTAERWDWSHDGVTGDILAYRVVKL